MKKSRLKTLGKKVSEFLVDVDENSSYAQWYSAISDIIDSKLFKEPVIKSKCSIPKNICKIRFENKGIELINLGRILRSKSVLESLPSDGNLFESPTVVYNLLPPISSSISINLYLNLR